MPGILNTGASARSRSYAGYQSCCVAGSKRSMSSVLTRTLMSAHSCDCCTVDLLFRHGDVVGTHHGAARCGAPVRRHRPHPVRAHPRAGDRRAALRVLAWRHTAHVLHAAGVRRPSSVHHASDQRPSRDGVAGAGPGDRAACGWSGSTRSPGPARCRRPTCSRPSPAPPTSWWSTPIALPPRSPSGGWRCGLATAFISRPSARGSTARRSRGRCRAPGTPGRCRRRSRR